MTPNSASAPVLVLDGESTPVRALIRDLWKSRDLMTVLARKEFFVRYRRASFGLVWAVGLPLIQALVLAVVLHHFVRFKTAGSYPVFVFSGVLVWNFFSNGLMTSTVAIVDNSEVSTKIYFPRAVFPVVTVLAGVYGLALTTVLLIGFSSAYGTIPGIKTLLLLPGVVLVITLTLAAGVVLAALQVYFRDVKFVVQAALMGWFYLTPVFYPLHSVGPIWRWLRINPMTGVVELFRAATVGADAGWLPALWWTVGWSALLVILAALLYRRFDRVFSDLL